MGGSNWSLSARRAWIEIYNGPYSGARALSLSARRAWIEICNLNRAHGAAHVALRKESVDRNTNMMESSRAANWSLSARRAWIEMSRAPVPHLPMASLSARRAWIEISVNSHTSFLPRVALRKESVDRNTVYGIVITFENWSLSARRAWIEISIFRLVTLTGCGRSPQGERG